MKLLTNAATEEYFGSILISPVVNVIRKFNPFQFSVTFLKETSYLICTANQLACFYTQCNNGLKYSTVVSIWLTKYK